MSNKQTMASSFDSIKWGVVVILFLAAIGANHFFQDIPGALRAIAWIVLLSILFAIAAFTTKGKLAVGFTKEARIELRKVVWPVRQETVRTTVLVIVLVIIMGLLMWAVDSLLFKLVQFLTGQ